MKLGQIAGMKIFILKKSKRIYLRTLLRPEHIVIWRKSCWFQTPYIIYELCLQAPKLGASFMLFLKLINTNCT